MPSGPWADNPLPVSPSVEPLPPIVSPKTKTGLSLTILSPTIIGAILHFDRRLGKRGRSVPCFGEGQCTYCERWRPFYRGYLSALLMPGKLSCLGEISDLPAAQLEAIRLAHGGSLRGARVNVHRTGAEPSSPMGVKLVGWELDPAALRDPEDVVGLLESHWQIKRNALAQQTEGV